MIGVTKVVIKESAEELKEQMKKQDLLRNKI